MGRDDLNSAERRWRSRRLFRSERRPRRAVAALLLLAVGGLWLAFDPAVLAAAKSALVWLLPAG